MKSVSASQVEALMALSRLEQRFDDLEKATGARFEGHSADQAESSRRVADIERSIAWVKAWAAGAVAVLSLSGALIANAISKVPQRVWTVLIE
jgi:hypothetical protein